MIVPDIAEYEEGDSYLAIKTISDLHTEIDELKIKIERLNKRVKECEEAYLITRHQYSELETKYLTDEYIINELEKWISQNKQWQIFSEKYIVWEDKLTEKIKELKGDSSNE